MRKPSRLGKSKLILHAGTYRSTYRIVAALLRYSEIAPVVALYWVFQRLVAYTPVSESRNRLMTQLFMTDYFGPASLMRYYFLLAVVKRLPLL